MSVKASQKIKVSMRINTRGGANTFPGWSKKNAEEKPETFTFLRENMKMDKNPDLKKALSVTFGFGLWLYDTTRFPLEIELRKAKAVDPAERFLIPRPTAGTMIDGAYRKDWGYENVLYLWTPPEFIRLSGQDSAVGKTVGDVNLLFAIFKFYKKNAQSSRAVRLIFLFELQSFFRPAVRLALFALFNFFHHHVVILFVYYEFLVLNHQRNNQQHHRQHRYAGTQPQSH